MPKVLDQSDRSIFQIAISFEPFDCFLYFFCMKIEYHNTFEMVQSFFLKKSNLCKIDKNGRNRVLGFYAKLSH